MRRPFSTSRKSLVPSTPTSGSSSEGSPRVNAWRTGQRLPARTPESDAMSKDLKKRGFNFVGSTICYAFMQAVGMVNDHSVECFRYAQSSPDAGALNVTTRRPGRPRPGRRAKLARVSAGDGKEQAELCPARAGEGTRPCVERGESRLVDIVKYMFDTVTLWNPPFPPCAPSTASTPVRSASCAKGCSRARSLSPKYACSTRSPTAGSPPPPNSVRNWGLIRVISAASCADWKSAAWSANHSPARMAARACWD